MVFEEENQKEQDITQTQEQLTDLISLFCAVSGIKLYLFPAQAKHFQIKPCSFCHSDKASDCIDELTQRTENLSYCKSGLYLCPHKKFRVCVPIYNRNHLSHIIISDPLSFSSKDDKPQTEDNNLDFHEHLLEHPVVSPSRLIKAARLLRHTLGAVPEQNEREAIRHQFLSAAEEGNIASARKLPEQFFLKTVTQNGTAFTDIKNNCLDLILILEELTADILQCELPENSERIFSNWCNAETIGKLKECVNIATEQFVSAAFYQTLQKHTALMQEAILYIKQHYKNKLTEEHVASLVYISPSYFSKIFKENVGCSFNEYVNHLRIEKAKALLLRPELALAQISSMVGYENRSYFGKIFKAKTGTTPAKYRQYHK